MSGGSSVGDGVMEEVGEMWVQHWIWGFCIPDERGGSVKLTGGHVPHLSFIYLKEINPQIKVYSYFKRKGGGVR